MKVNQKSGGVTSQQLSQTQKPDKLPAGLLLHDKTPDTVPLFRMRNTVHGDHFYTTDATEIPRAQAGKWELEGTDPVGFLFKHEGPGRAPLFRLWNLAVNDHAYTADPAFRDRLIAEGYASEGIIGYVPTAPREDTVTMHVARNERTGDTFVAEGAEVASARAGGWVPTGETFAALSQAQPAEYTTATDLQIAQINAAKK